MTRGGLSIDVAINALEEKGLARTLAEPNLVALSGDTASFLAGGEFPIPVPGGLGTVTIDYKKYGVGLAFTPTVLRDGLINLKIEPEVSELDYSHPVQIAGILDSAADRAPRLDDGRAARRPELRDRRPVAEQEHERAAAIAVARRRAGAGRAVPQRGVQEERDRSRHHRHAAPRASDPPGRPGQDAARQHAAGQRRRLLPDGQGGDLARRGSARGRPPAAVRRPHSRYCARGAPMSSQSRTERRHKALAAIVALGALLGGCSDIYYDRRETVALGADDHIAANRVAQMVDPWPRLRGRQEHRLQRRADAGGGRALSAQQGDPAGQRDHHVDDAAAGNPAGGERQRRHDPDHARRARPPRRSDRASW